MNSNDFQKYKRRYRTAIEAVLQELDTDRLDENGFPAYAHLNPLINWLFWKRIHSVINHLETDAPHERTLAFGSGSGVMLPFLAGMSREVLATDIDLLPLECVRRHILLAENVHIQRSSAGSLSDLPAASENRLYRIGRKLAGSEFSGDYHRRGVQEIRQALGKVAEIRSIATLYWPTPLFEVFAP